MHANTLILKLLGLKVCGLPTRSSQVRILVSVSLVHNTSPVFPAPHIYFLSSCYLMAKHMLHTLGLGYGSASF